MIKIGDFSKMNMITIKTLRHYDELGILKPCFVDEFTNYRYYSGKEIDELHEILKLKEVGCSLQEIMDIKLKKINVRELLVLKEREVLQNIHFENAKLKRINNYLNGGKEDMEKVIIKKLPKSIVVSYRKIIKDYTELNELLPNVVGKEMERLGCVCAKPAYCFNIYHDGEYRDNNIDVEICEAVTEKKEDTKILKFKEFEKVEKAACIIHKGPYKTLGKSYAKVFTWIEENGYKTTENPRESYIDGIWNKESEEEWITEIQIPIK